MTFATQEVHRLRHEYIGPEHILLGLMMEEDEIPANVLKGLGVDLPMLRGALDKLVKHGEIGVLVTVPPLTPRGRKAIESAAIEVRRFGHDWIGTPHLLLGLLCERDGMAAQMLASLGLEVDRVREEVLSHMVPRPDPKLLGVSLGELIEEAIKSLRLAREMARAEGNESLASVILGEVERLKTLNTGTGGASGRSGS
jgi:ATP-dependent Clp protease ATP-binding subunit ClpC